MVGALPGLDKDDGCPGMCGRHLLRKLGTACASGTVRSRHSVTTIGMSEDDLEFRSA